MAKAKKPMKAKAARAKTAAKRKVPGTAKKKRGAGRPRKTTGL